MSDLKQQVRRPAGRSIESDPPCAGEARAVAPTALEPVETAKTQETGADPQRRTRKISPPRLALPPL